VGVDQKMALRALFAAIRWVLARFLAPGAGTAAESSATRSQSMRFLLPWLLTRRFC
jgi:hypothetical protein